MKLSVVGNRPVPAEIARQVELLLHDVPHAQLLSAYRGDAARSLLKRLGGHTQAFLYHAWRRRLPGFNPANPPGRSTHELRSDGVAYRGPVGRKLSYWCVGMDVDDGHVAAFKRAAAKHGWIAFQPYPG